MEARSSAAVAAPHTSQAAILLVDDNPALLQTTQALLADGDWRCVTCADTISALCAIVEHKPGVVLVDCETGPLDAWKFCVLVREHPDYCRTRLILVGREDGALARAKASAAGADALLVKPFTAEDVHSVLALQGRISP